MSHAFRFAISKKDVFSKTDSPKNAAMEDVLFVTPINKHYSDSRFMNAIFSSSAVIGDLNPLGMNSWNIFPNLPDDVAKKAFNMLCNGNVYHMPDVNIWVFSDKSKILSNGNDIDFEKSSTEQYQAFVQKTLFGDEQDIW